MCKMPAESASRNTGDEGEGGGGEREGGLGPMKVTVWGGGWKRREEGGRGSSHETQNATCTKTVLSVVACALS